MSKKLVDVKPLENYNIQLGLQLAMFADGTREWRGELEELNLPQDAITWQPYENAHSIGAEILHIADVESFWIKQVAANQDRSDEELKRFLSQETQQYEGIWPTPPNEPLSWYWAQCDAIRAQTLDLVSELADPELVADRPQRKSIYTLRWILHHVLTHEAYHGGQAVLLGLIYGKLQ